MSVSSVGSSPAHGGVVSRRQALRAVGVVGFSSIAAACSADSGRAGSDSTTSPVSSSSGTEVSSPAGTSGASTPAEAVTLDDATTATLDRLFDSAFLATGVAGLAAAVWIGEDTWRRTTGYANLADRTPFDPTDHVRIASITKSFTATAVLQLVDQGKIALADTLETYVPGVANGAEVTVQDLLGMTSGIFDFTSDDAFLAAFTADPTLPWSSAQTLEVIARHEPLFAPGSEVAYCDSNYVLLGMILHKVTGAAAGDVITTNVIDRLPLPATTYPTENTIAGPHPTGYVPVVTDPNAPFDNVGSPPTIVDHVNPAVAGTAGAMISTLDDLRVWGNELAAGTLLSPATQALRLQGRPFPGQKINIGYGLGCERLNDFVGHNGAIFGFSSVVMRRPQTDFTIAAVANESTNFTTPTSSFVYAVIKELFPDQWV